MLVYVTLNCVQVFIIWLVFETWLLLIGLRYFTCLQSFKLIVYWCLY